MSVQLSRDLFLINAAAFLRSFNFGLTGVVLGIYLFRVGLSSFSIGMIIGAGLVGSALATIGVTTQADRFGRRRTLTILALLGAAGAAALALTPTLPFLMLMAFVGMLNGTGTDRSAAFSLEQAIIPGLVPATSRTWTLSWYNVVLDAAGSLGALAAGLPFLLQRWLSLPLVASYRAVFVGCAFLNVATAVLYPFASAGVEVSKPATETSSHHVSPATKKVVAKLAGLFSLDAFGGGFLTDALVAYWFFIESGSATVPMPRGARRDGCSNTPILRRSSGIAERADICQRHHESGAERFLGYRFVRGGLFHAERGFLCSLGDRRWRKGQLRPAPLSCLPEA